METEAVSWDWGPSESRFVRALLYLAFGWMAGYVGVTLLSLLSISLGSWRDLSFFVVATVGFLLSPLLILYLVIKRSRRNESPSIHSHWLMQEFWEEFRLMWFVAIVLASGGILWVLDGRFGAVPFFVMMALFLGTVLLVGLLSSKGELDPESRTLSYSGYATHRVVNLESVVDVKCLPFGNRAFLWVSVEPEVENRRRVQGLYAVPTDIADRVRPPFERNRDATLSVREKAPAFLPGTRRGLVGFLVLLIGVVIVLAWGGVPMEVIALAVVGIGGYGLLYLAAAAGIK